MVSSFLFSFETIAIKNEVVCGILKENLHHPKGFLPCLLRYHLNLIYKTFINYFGILNLLVMSYKLVIKNASLEGGK